MCAEHNEIQEINPEFGALQSLQELNLSHNYLQKLPDDLALLQALRRLFLSGNRLAGKECGRQFSPFVRKNVSLSIANLQLSQKR